MNDTLLVPFLSGHQMRVNFIPIIDTLLIPFLSGHQMRVNFLLLIWQSDRLYLADLPRKVDRRSRRSSDSNIPLLHLPIVKVHIHLMRHPFQVLLALHIATISHITV